MEKKLSKAEAARLNGKKGGRPRKNPPAEAVLPAQSLAEAQRNVRKRKRDAFIEIPAHLVPLDRRERLFVQEYLIDLNASAAYLRAGYKGQPLKVGGLAARKIRQDRVAAAIQVEMAERSKRIHIDQDRVLLELARIGFSDVRKIFELRAGQKPTNGVELYLANRKPGDERAFEALPAEAQAAWNAAADLIPAASGGYFLKSPGALDDATAAAIAGVEVVTKSIGDGEVEYVHKIKFLDKTPTLNLMGRHLGMWHEKGDPTGKREADIDPHATDDELLAEAKRLIAKFERPRPEARA